MIYVCLSKLPFTYFMNSIMSDIVTFSVLNFIMSMDYLEYRFKLQSAENKAKDIGRAFQNRG